MMYKINSKNKKVLLQVLIFILCIMQSGCWDQQLLGDIKIELSVGVEKGKDESLIVTRSAPIFEEDIQAKEEIITTNVYSLRESRGVASTLSANRIAGGKTQQLMLSKELAAEGIADIMNIVERDPVNPFNQFIVVVDGSPKELLEIANKFNDKPKVGYYLYRLMENNIKNLRMPETRPYNFFTNYFALGVDPITPMIELESRENKGIKVKGCALFSGG